MNRFLTLLFVNTFFQLNPLSAQHPQDSIIFLQKVKTYEQYLQKFQQQHNLPSLSFAIIKDQKIFYSNGIGFADIENKITATDSTAYSIASLTKPIAATLILKLHETGKLEINRPMREYWPLYDRYFQALRKELPEKNPQLMFYIEDYNFDKYEITIKHHLTHTSQGEPGNKFKYNGFLFGRLVSVVDHVVPEKFIGMMDKYIFKALNFKHSFLEYDELVKNERPFYAVAKPYQKFDLSDSLVEAKFPDPRKLNAGAGLILSVRDLAKFDIAFDRNELISASTKALMLTPAKSNKGKTLQYALGWFVGKHKGRDVIYHYGLQESYSSFYLKLPQQNITLLILCNSSGLTLDYGKYISDTKLSSVPYAAAFLRIF